MKAHLEEAVLGVVAFAAPGTGQVAAPGGSLTIVILGDGEGCSAAAGDQEHAEVFLCVWRLCGLGPGFHDAVIQAMS